MKPISSSHSIRFRTLLYPQIFALFSLSILVVCMLHVTTEDTTNPIAYSFPSPKINAQKYIMCTEGNTCIDFKQPEQKQGIISTMQSM